MDQNRTQRREERYSLPGRLPDRKAPIRAEVLSRSHRDGYILEDLVLTVDMAGEETNCEPIPAYFLIPEGPAILYNHSHGAAMNPATLCSHPPDYSFCSYTFAI